MVELTREEQKVKAKMAFMQGRECDKFDYLIAVFSGTAAGFIDSFFVGSPQSSILGGKVDETADDLVKNASKMLWKLDKRSNRPRKCPQSLQQAISYLEQAFPVNYDARHGKDLMNDNGRLAGMRPANHHLISLAHSPDIIGLIFSIIDQFTDKASFISKGKIIRVTPSKTSKAIPYLQGTNLISRIFCGFVNWLGHLMSDLVGASSTRQKGKTGRGSGIPIPFYELLLLCDFGDINGETFAQIAIDMFEHGYDARFGVTMAIPVMVNELMIRMFWVIRKKFFFKCKWEECIPSKKNPDLRIMLIVGSGALCIGDGIDAAIRSKGNTLDFLLHINLPAWYKLISMVFKEIMIRYNFSYSDLAIAFSIINKELDEYLGKLRSIDFDLYEKEFKQIQEMQYIIQSDQNDYEMIYKYLETIDNNLQFHSFSEFDSLMQDENFVLNI